MFSEIINDFWNSGFPSAIKYTLTGMIGNMKKNKTEDNE